MLYIGVNLCMGEQRECNELWLAFVCDMRYKKSWDNYFRWIILEILLTYG